MLLRTLILATLVVGTPLAQEPASSERRPAPPSAVEAVFYRAYFTERALEDNGGALILYREFLDKAPQNLLAGQAARYAGALLDKAGKKAEAGKLRDKHRAIIAETLQAGLNASYLDPKTDVSRMVSRFESESREVFKHRRKILDLVGLKSGQTIADIGAGTGLFTNLFARVVGNEGKVYAVDIGPVLVAHLRRLKTKMNLPQIDVVHCTDRSSKLPPNSVDVVFICDTYHHFSHPHDTMTSIQRALRPGGQLILVDFYRIEGKSRSWIMGHIRAGKSVFRAEIEKAGFRLVRQEATPFLKENYLLRFERRRS